MDEDGMIHWAHDDLGYYDSCADWTALVDEWQQQQNPQHLHHHSDVWPPSFYPHNDQIPGSLVADECVDELEISSPLCETPTSHTLLLSNSDRSPRDYFLTNARGRCSSNSVVLTCV